MLCVASTVLMLTRRTEMVTLH